MSVNSEHKQKYIERLQNALKTSWLKRDVTSFNSSSVAVTSSGEYVSGLFESRTHLLDITSEQAALVLAVSSKDAHVSEVVTLVDGPFLVNPLVIKVLADHVRRTGTHISYSVYNKAGEQLFHLSNVLDTYYKPQVEQLEKIKEWSPQMNVVPYDSSRSVVEQLREAATKGMETHFSSGTKTLYGSAVLADDTIYYGGVYSSFDRRLNLHAEMCAAISAINAGKRITDVAIVSTKFSDEVAHMCGCCRQFFSEIQEKTGPIRVHNFSQDGKHQTTLLSDYMPYMWSSR